MLTKVQAELIFRLQSRGYLHDGSQIEPKLAFPGDDRRDKSSRATLERMAQKQFFRKHVHPWLYYEPVMTEINKAYADFLDKNANKEWWELLPEGA